MPATELIYDPVRTFLDVFSDSITASEIGEALTCDEVNAMAALLEAYGATDAAASYLDSHRKPREPDGDDPAPRCAEPGLH